jgi:BON domain-containing protein
MQNELNPTDDARDEVEQMGGDSDVPGYQWRGSGAADSTGRDPGAPPLQGQSYAQGGGIDEIRAERAAVDADPADRAVVDEDRGTKPQPFGDGRYGRPDEWSSQQADWPNRPSRYEDANSGFGRGMGAGMSWTGESAREDDAMRGPYAGRGPRGYRRADARIAEDVSDRLTDDEYVDASDITVTVRDAVVVLEGTIESADARDRAANIARSCSGVQDVENRVTVRAAAGTPLDTADKPLG